MEGRAIEVGCVNYDDFTRSLLAEQDAERVRIEASMTMVSEMFVDTQMITLEQGKVLDRIDLHTGMALGHSQKAVEQLEITDRRQRNKKFCVCSVMVLTVVGTVALIICLTALGKTFLL